MTCDDWQIAFEQRSAGAETSVSAAELDAHIASCAACTAYVALSRKVTMSLNHSIATAPPPLSLDEIRARLAKIHRRMRRAPIMSAVATAAAMMMMQLYEHPGDLGGLVAAVIGVAIGTGLVLAAMAPRRRRELAEAAAVQTASDGSLLRSYRDRLDREITGNRNVLILAPIVAVLLVLWKYPQWPWMVLAAGAVVNIPVAVVAYRRRVRERALLSD
jgi:hypothetical protein